MVIEEVDPTVLRHSRTHWDPHFQVEQFLPVVQRHTQILRGSAIVSFSARTPNSRNARLASLVARPVMNLPTYRGATHAVGDLKTTSRRPSASLSPSLLPRTNGMIK